MPDTPQSGPGRPEDDEPLGDAPLGDAPLTDDPAAVDDPVAIDDPIAIDDPVDGQPMADAPEVDEGEVPMADGPAEPPQPTEPIDPAAVAAVDDDLADDDLADEGDADDGDADDSDEVLADEDVAALGVGSAAATSSPSSSGRDLLVVGAVVVVVLAVVAAFVLLRDRGSEEVAVDPTADAAAAGGSEAAGDPAAPPAVTAPSGPVEGVAYSAYGEDVDVEALKADLEPLVGAEAVALLDDPSGATPEQQAALYQGISTVISRGILERAADEAGVTVEDDAVEAEYAQLLEEGFQGDQAALDAQITAAGLTDAALRDVLRTRLLAEGLVDTPEIDDAAIQEAYDAQFADPLVSHLLVETEEEAQAALERIQGGEAFADVASEVSIDGSAAQGGALGPLVEGQFVAPFEEAAFALQPGEVSDVVETEFGFHVITVEDPPPLSEVETTIRGALEDQAFTTAFTELSAQLDEEAQVTVAEELGTWGGLGRGLVPPAVDLPLEPPAQTPPQTPAPTEG